MTNPFSKVRYQDHLLLARLLNGNRRGDGNNYIVLRDYSILYWRKTDDQDGPGTVITVPAGMLTDLASVPQIARSFLSVSGRHTEASIVHDYCYLYQKGDPGPNSGLDRDEADYLFLQLMRQANVDPPDRDKAFLAVRAAGRAVYEDRNDIRNVRESHPQPELEEERLRMFEQWGPLLDQVEGTDWAGRKPALPGESPHSEVIDEVPEFVPEIPR